MHDSRRSSTVSLVRPFSESTFTVPDEAPGWGAMLGLAVVLTLAAASTAVLIGWG